MKNYAGAILLGAIGGGRFVTLATKASPKVMAQMMSGIMEGLITPTNDK